MKTIFATTILFAVLATAALPALAQDRGSAGAGAPQGAILGSVTDADTGEAVEGATVAVWNAADSSLVTGAVSAAEGRFNIEGLRPGQYYVKVSYIGFTTETVAPVALERGSMRADLGTVVLAPDTAFLDEVEVTAERAFMEVSIDRTVYNTKDQPISAGGTATDVLRSVPSVEVDIDGNVSLRGSQNVAIHINGRPAPMTGEALTSFLQGLSAEMVERVEVIPNPSAKYEPDGMSGILNIVLKKDTDLGLGGSINAGVGTLGSYNAAGTVNYGKGPLSVFANYSFRNGKRENEGDRFRENRYDDPLTYLDQGDFGERTSLSHNLSTTIDYSLSKQNTLSLSALFSRRGGDNLGVNAYRFMDADQQLTNRYERRSEGDRTDFNQDYRLTFRRILEPGKHELTTEVRFEVENEDEFDRYTQQQLTLDGLPANDTPELQTNDLMEQSREVSLRADYVRPIGEKGKLEAGYDGELERLDSDFFSESFDYGAGRFVPDLSLNNAFIYEQQTHALYTTYGQDVGRFGFQAGVRLEQAFTDFALQTTDDAFENDYFSIFPSVFVTYKLSDNPEASHSVKASYSKRIDRPNTWQLNPFSDYDDPLFRRVGNPYLKPEYIHSFEASYTHFTSNLSFTVTPYFRRTVNEIRWYETVNDDGVSILTFENFDTSDSWGGEVIGTLRLGDRFNGYASFNAYRVVTDGSNVDTGLSNDAIGWTARVNGSYKLTPTLDLQASWFYRAPMDIENGRIAAFSMADIALRQKFLGDKASLSLRVSDPFNTGGMQIWREDETFYQVFTRDWSSQQAHLTFTYNFGQQSRDRNRRQRGDQEGGDGGEDMQGY